MQSRRDQHKAEHKQPRADEDKESPENLRVAIPSEGVRVAFC